MAEDAFSLDNELSAAQKPAIRFLIESALKSLKDGKEEAIPGNKAEWVAKLGKSLMAQSDQEYESVLAALIANGVSSQELHQYYIPEASRYLGEKWVSDEASFVDVTTGASRLQALFRNAPDGPVSGQIVDRSIPLGESVLIVIPIFEQHSLGAFVAADGFRRHGLWVRMAIGMSEVELAELLNTNRFSLLGLSLGTWNSVEKASGLIDYIRTHVDHTPPIVAGGRVVEDRVKVERRTGADFAVQSVREAVERCGLASIAQLTSSDGVL